MSRVVAAIIVAWVGLVACEDTTPRRSIFGQSTLSDKRAKVTPERPVRLPADHASHPAYQLEWWYLTAILEDEQQTAYGLQFTLFRFSTSSASPSNWSNAQQWMAHASLHTPDSHLFESRFASGEVGNAGVKAQPFTAFLDNWQWQSTGAAPFPAKVTFSIENQADIALSLTQTGPFILQGDQGFSQKSADGNYRSYYYSLPFIDIQGSLQLNNRTHTLKGIGWYDHEWTSELASKDALGWDWFSLHLDNGDKLMAFRMHVNEAAPYVTGTYIRQGGQKYTLTDTAISMTPQQSFQVAGRTVPLKWRVQVPDHQIDVQISPFKIDQWNPGRFPYYEGRVELSGSHTGAGFMELTGY